MDADVSHSTAEHRTPVIANNTHSFQRMKACFATSLLCILWKSQGISGYAVGERTICPTSEGPPSKYKLICTNAERPPIYGIRISTLGQNLGGHVCHGACYTSKEPPIIVVNSDIEIREMSMATLIKKDIIRFEVPDIKEMGIMLVGYLWVTDRCMIRFS